MNLWDCAVRYIALPDSVLKLKTKVSLLAALTAYREESTASLIQRDDSSLSPYQVRRIKETTGELLRHGVIDEAKAEIETEIETEIKADADTGLVLLPTGKKADKSKAKMQILIPANIDYQTLTVSSIKVLLACYSEVRYSRTPFRLEMPQAELAQKANVTEKSLRAALIQLSEHRLVALEKLWRTATRVTLLDPESGVELYYIGKFYQDRLDRIPVFDRYKVLLQDHDPRDHLRHERGPAAKETVNCPFCHGKLSRTFTFEADELAGIDRWRCHRCKRSGNSAQLWAKLEPWIGKRDWRMVISESVGMTEQRHDDGEEPWN